MNVLIAQPFQQFQLSKDCGDIHTDIDPNLIMKVTLPCQSKSPDRKNIDKKNHIRHGSWLGFSRVLKNENLHKKKVSNCEVGQRIKNEPIKIQEVFVAAIV